MIDRDQFFLPGNSLEPPNGEKSGNSSPTKKNRFPTMLVSWQGQKGYCKKLREFAMSKKKHVILVGILGGVGG